MIKRLRRKVFWSILLSAASVLLVILLTFNLLNLEQNRKTANEILDSAAELLSNQREGHGHGRKGRGSPELLRSVSKGELVVLELDEGGTVRSAAGVPDEAALEAMSDLIEVACSDKDGSGSRNGWLYRSNQEGRRILLLNAASLRSEALETAGLSLLGFLVSCVLFALVAGFLSRRIVQPVDEAMQAQKRFVADASHELKTPLAVIDANAAVLEHQYGRSKWLGYIQEESARMAELVAQLLQLSRLDEVQQEKERLAQPYDAVSAVMEAALPFESLAFEEQKGLELELPEALQTTGDPGAMGQLTGILLDNAIKHAEPGSAVLLHLGTASQRHGFREEQALVLRVTNHGEEIPPEDLPYLFERFYRVDSARTRRSNSYGLGLAIAKELTQQQGGSITVTSREGVTEFVVRLPMG